ncbi:MAG: phosphatase PAP2 family protein [Candidatus Eiseniibacteriota bacterium]
MRLLLAAGIASCLICSAATAAPPSFQRSNPPTLLLSDTAAGSQHASVLGQVAMAGAAIGAGFLLDDTIEPGSGPGTFVDKAGNALGSVYVLGGGTAIVALDGWIENDKGTLGLAKDLTLALGASTATVAIFKATVNRERPDGSDDRSFPSGHSANSFAAATVLERHYGGAVGWIAYGAATFVAASRVIGDHHFLSDVVTGAVIGIAYGRLVTDDQ